MKTATVREVQHGLAALLDRVERGEEITITRRGKVVARLAPPAPKKKKKLEWPDFEARLKEDFPDGPPPGKPCSQIVIEARDRD